GDQLTVLDISLDKNRDDLVRILEAGASVRYFDHHFAGDIPQHPALETYIDTDANACSSLLVNEYLGGRFLPWAVTAAYGDNLFLAAEQAAEPLDLSREQLDQLKLLGTVINYNGYGASIEDLIYDPQQLYRLIAPFEDPFAFINEAGAYTSLLQGYQNDMQQALSLKSRYEDVSHALYVLPEARWARRVSGVFANDMAQNYPDRAHALLTKKKDGGYLISVRAPLNNKTGADDLCRQFETGGGRKAAAGINHLPASDFDKFQKAFLRAF
ncbi:MAG: DHH family phosphoesterase, partial [Gammaproteobacteria bacterium]|nr:DHH family phosphoesterase [Gammaproteobacteria bacterium]